MKLLVVASCLAQCLALPQHMITLSNGAKVPADGHMITLDNGAVVPAGIHMITMPNGAVVPASGPMTTLSNGAVVPSHGHMTVHNGVVVPSSGPMVFHANGAVVPSIHSHVPAVKAAHHVPAAKAAHHVPAVVSHPNGAKVPADTPAVQAAKAAHVASVATAKANFHHAGGNINPSVGVAPSVAYSHVPSVKAAHHIPAVVSHPNGAKVPADTPAVQAAKAAHVASVATAKANFHHAGGNINPSVGVAPSVAYSHVPAVKTAHHIPAVVSHPNGAKVPADTPAIQAAKAAHVASVATAKANFHHAGGNINPSMGVAPSVAYSHVPAVKTAHHIPAVVSHPNGAMVPADTPAVQAAKAAHVAAGGVVHHKAGMKYAHHGMVAHHNGAVVPVDTIDVQSARAAHKAAHAIV